MEVFVATDLWGAKENVILRFPAASPPPLAELTAVIEHTYHIETLARKPPHIPHRHVPHFRVAHLQILRPSTRFEPERWEPLVTELQLHDRAQLFVFQPPHPFHSDVRALLPSPREVGAEAVVLSPRRAKLTPLDAAHMAFRLLDLPQRGAVSVAELREVLDAMGLDLSLVSASSGGRLNFADPARRFLSFREWLAFAEACPNVVALIVQRLGGGGGSGPPALSSAAFGAASMALRTSTDPSMSPPRHRPPSAERQGAVSARLSSGLASIVTKKDRQQEGAAAAAARSMISPRSPDARGVATTATATSPSPARRLSRGSCSTPTRSRTPKRAASTLVQPRWNLALKR